MTEYNLNWITPNLAVGGAPMSYEELDLLKEHGINAILNLCAEFCDLHQIEQGEGFEVYYMPVEDDSAPNIEAMEKALAWLDEAIYLGKKVLVHCRHGIGRTGTFVTAYLLRRGLGLKMAEKKLKNTRATPSSYTQWKLLKKYGKQTGELKIREPSLENKRTVELGGFFAEYEAICRDLKEKRKNAVQNGLDVPECGKKTSSCCHTPFHVLFIEAVYVNHQMGRTLTSQDRMAVLNEAARLTAYIKKNAIQHRPCPISVRSIETGFASFTTIAPSCAGLMAFQMRSYIRIWCKRCCSSCLKACFLPFPAPLHQKRPCCFLFWMSSQGVLCRHIFITCYSYKIVRPNNLRILQEGSLEVIGLHNFKRLMRRAPVPPFLPAPLYLWA